ncbi:MAG TPA: glycosyltransferase family 2 protein [Planktothrix sp.]
MKEIGPDPEPLTSESAQRQPVLSLVVTLYNEAENIEPMTRNLVAALQAQLDGIPFELVLVLNGSLDETPARAAELAKEISEIKLVSLEINQGFGGGIQAGLAAASGELIGYTDADEQISAADTVRVCSVALEKQHDLVKAVRTTRTDGINRLVVTTVYNALFRLMYQVSNPDINGKPKILKRNALKGMKLSCKDWFIDAEIMIQARKLNLSVAEVPISFSARTRGKSNVRVSTIWEFLLNMWKYRNEHN